MQTFRFTAQGQPAAGLCMFETAIRFQSASTDRLAMRFSIRIRNTGGMAVVCHGSSVMPDGLACLDTEPTDSALAAASLHTSGHIDRRARYGQVRHGPVSSRSAAGQRECPRREEQTPEKVLHDTGSPNCGWTNEPIVVGGRPLHNSRSREPSWRSRGVLELPKQ